MLGRPPRWLKTKKGAARGLRLAAAAGGVGLLALHHPARTAPPVRSAGRGQRASTPARPRLPLASSPRPADWTVRSGHDLAGLWSAGPGAYPCPAPVRPLSTRSPGRHPPTAAPRTTCRPALPSAQVRGPGGRPVRGHIYAGCPRQRLIIDVPGVRVNVTSTPWSAWATRRHRLLATGSPRTSAFAGGGSVPTVGTLRGSPSAAVRGLLPGLTGSHRQREVAGSRHCRRSGQDV